MSRGVKLAVCIEDYSVNPWEEEVPSNVMDSCSENVNLENIQKALILPGCEFEVLKWTWSQKQSCCSDPDEDVEKTVLRLVGGPKKMF
jgi:hypothetical protein